MAPKLDEYVAAFDDARQRWQAGGPDALAQTREEALHRFLALGLPTTRDEEWRFTSVAPIAERAFTLPSGTPTTMSDAARIDAGGLQLPGAAASLVFLNGEYAPALSTPGVLPHGVRVESLRSALASRPGDLQPHLARVAPFERQAFTALNTAFLFDGAAIHLPPHAVVDSPIQVVFLSTGGGPIMAHPRVLVVLGDDSQASIVERYVGPDVVDGADGHAYLTNAVTEVVLGRNTVLDHYKLQDEGSEAFHVSTLHVQGERGASVTSHSIGFGGALVRNDVVAVLDGEGIECVLNGLYVADGRRLVDNHTTIDHARPHCASRELYKGILADGARGVFNGKIIVRPDAQKTDAKQTNRALLLSKEAQINTKPQLEIFANDVRCTHGAAVGQLDEEAVFYLRSRGLGAREARRILIHAFAADVVTRMRLEPVRSHVERALARRLARALPAAA